jgi:hypothetical protein
MHLAASYIDCTFVDEAPSAMQDDSMQLKDESERCMRLLFHIEYTQQCKTPIQQPHWIRDE